jgi:hypothetical protein
MWLGRTVLAVTLVMDLSTSLGERPGAITTPSLPMPVRENWL